MDLETLHKIDENLTSIEVKHLKFLCMDLVSKKRLEAVHDAKDLFQRLKEQALLDDELLLPELLITIGRLDLLENVLQKSKEEVENNLPEHISPYRKMLFSIYEDMTEENIRTAKFLLNLPKAKIGASASFLDVLIELEKQQKLSEDNLGELYKILDKCDKKLAERIEEFRNLFSNQEQGGRPPMQEESNNGHDSLPRRMQAVTVKEARRDSLVTDSDIMTDDYYQLTQQPLGYCLIINNFEFENNSSYSNRKGTEKDEEELRKVFERMHFEIEVKDDLKASQMKEVINEFAKRDHSQMGAFVCCVLSHGKKGSVLGVDGEPVEIHELTLPFSECRTLASKPKLFFIQACQGNETQKGVWVKDGRNDATEEEPYEEDARIATVCRNIPIKADFLIGMATVEHFQSFRHTRDGSIYIQELCRQLRELCPKKEDILSILTKVNSEVSIRFLKGYKQMPEPRYTLTKKLVLPID